MEKDLKQLLSEGIVEFTFKKKNGEIRTAKGSRSIEVLMNTPSSGFTEENKPTGTGKESTTSIPYWDFDKQAWRSVCIDAVISIDKVVEKGELFGANLFE